MITIITKYDLINAKMTKVTTKTSHIFTFTGRYMSNTIVMKLSIEIADQVTILVGYPVAS